MKERIKKIRRELNLTQQEFAERIGIKRNTIANYETGRNDPVDSVISLICREFDVREEWLRNGEGEMFKPKPSDVLDQMAYKYQFSNADYVLVEKFVSLSPNKRKELVENVFGFLHNAEAALSGSDPYAPAYAGNDPPQPMDKLMESIRTTQNENPTASRTMQEMSREEIHTELDHLIPIAAHEKEGANAADQEHDYEIINNNELWKK